MATVEFNAYGVRAEANGSVVRAEAIIVQNHVELNGVPIPVAGPPGGSGDGASRTTLLSVTQQSPSGTVFFVNSGSTHYTFSGEIGNLGASVLNYLSNEAVQIYLRGGKLLKEEHTEWVTEYSFTLYMPVDIGDYLEILS